MTRPAKLWGSSRELHGPCFGKRRGWDAKPLPTSGNRAGITSNRSWRHPTCTQRDHSSQRWEQMLSWEGMGRSLLSHLLSQC